MTSSKLNPKAPSNYPYRIRDIAETLNACFPRVVAPKIHLEINGIKAQFIAQKNTPHIKVGNHQCQFYSQIKNLLELKNHNFGSADIWVIKKDNMTLYKFVTYLEQRKCVKNGHDFVFPNGMPDSLNHGIEDENIPTTSLLPAVGGDDEPLPNPNPDRSGRSLNSKKRLKEGKKCVQKEKPLKNKRQGKVMKKYQTNLPNVKLSQHELKNIYKFTIHFGRNNLYIHCVENSIRPQTISRSNLDELEKMPPGIDIGACKDIQYYAQKWVEKESCNKQNKQQHVFQNQ
eukprot:gb/GECH01009470.1/.p1 GENE.gb/GECH01009470.1/~~gb/GECH01009470.1/.p1  ORF type:complete len:286 (+),score=54.82 gb/GECH01009470.1/:1-858(+)